MMIRVAATLLNFVLAVAAFRGRIYLRENITDYETCQPEVLNRTESVDFPSAFWVRIATSKYNFTLHLKMNTVLLSPRFQSRHISDDRKNTIPGHVNCFYQGEVVGYPLWTAAVSTCNGLRGSFGVAGNNSLFHIEPVGRSFTSLNQIHALYFKKGMVNEKSACGTPHNHTREYSQPLYDAINESIMKVRRQSSSKNPIVELAVVNDQAQLQQFSGNVQATLTRAIEIINGVDNLYKNLGVRFALVEVTTWSSGNKIAVVSDSSTSLDNFAAYEAQITTQHDAALLLTGTKFSSNVIGIAYVGTMCSRRSAVGVVEDFSSAAAVSSTAAHELGHIFNMQHDSSNCQCAQRVCIMSAVLGNPPPTQWSSCSQSTLKASLASNLGSCLYNQPASTIGTPTPATKPATTQPTAATLPPTTQKATTNLPTTVQKSTLPATTQPPITTTPKATVASTLPPTTSQPKTELTTTSPGTVTGKIPEVAVCGNGIREGNEACDCGPFKVCLNPCCNATTCQLLKGAQCARGSCCANCHFVPYGTVCRRSNGECDIAEYCSGSSAECPNDQALRDGTTCGNNSGYCYNGTCSTRDVQCKAFYGQASGDGPSICYATYNPHGDVHGNCGSSNGKYISCTNGNVYCGSLQCLNYGSLFPVGILSGSISVGIHNSKQCKSFVQTPNYSNIWTVKDGTKCGTNKVCIGRQCTDIRMQPQCPTANGQTCSGHGVCSNNGTCVCSVGFTGADCLQVYSG